MSPAPTTRPQGGGLHERSRKGHPHSLGHGSQAQPRPPMLRPTSAKQRGVSAKGQHMPPLAPLPQGPGGPASAGRRPPVRALAALRNEPPPGRPHAPPHQWGFREGRDRPLPVPRGRTPAKARTGGGAAAPPRPHGLQGPAEGQPAAPREPGLGARARGLGHAGPLSEEHCSVHPRPRWACPREAWPGPGRPGAESGWEGRPPSPRAAAEDAALRPFGHGGPAPSMGRTEGADATEGGTGVLHPATRCPSGLPCSDQLCPANSDWGVLPSGHRSPVHLLDRPARDERGVHLPRPGTALRVGLGDVPDLGTLPARAPRP